jgi:hypothetical protein
MGKPSQTATIITYTYEVRSAVAFGWGPIDIFLRLDINDDFKVYNKYRSAASGVIDSLYDDGIWTLPIGSKYNPVVVNDDYFVLSTGGKVKSGRIYFGTDTQTVDTSLDTYCGHMGWTPAYKHVAYLSAHWNLGQNPAVPATSFTFARYFSPCAGITLNVIDPDGGRGLNPAQALYDILTSKYYGFGLGETYLDVDSFVSASITLFNEGLGVGHAITSGEIYNSIRAILDWIDGELVYKNGKITLTLRRKDYIPTGLPLLTEADIKARTFNFTRPSWYATKNVIYLNFNDINREHDQNTVYAEDLANQIMTGQVRVQEFNYDMHTNVPTAQKVVTRLLHRQSYPWAVVEFECFSAGNQLSLFECFRLRHNYYEIEGIFRVVEKVKQGPNIWKIQAIEDGFPPDSLFTGFQFEVDHPQYWDPNVVEWDVRFYESYYRGLLALPYAITPITFRAGATYDWELINNKPGMEWYAVPPMDSVLYQLDLDDDGEIEWVDETLYACVGTISPLNGAYITGDATSFIMEPDFHYMWDVSSVQVVLIDDEIMSISSIEPYESDPQKWYVTIAQRGIESTDADVHPANAMVLNLECRALNTEVPRLYTGTYDFQMVPHYLLPKPNYYWDGMKVKAQEFYELIKRPMDWGYGGIHWDSSSWDTTHNLYWYYDSRLDPIPIPCIPLSQYPQSTLEWCPYDSRIPFVEHCSDSWLTLDYIDSRSGTRYYIWAWDGYYEHSGETFIFDAHIGAPYDPDDAWTNDTFAFEEAVTNYSYTTSGGSAAYNFLSGQGVNATNLWEPSEVRARIYGLSSQVGITYSMISAQVMSAGGLSILGTCTWTTDNIYNEDNSFYGSASEGYGPYTWLLEPLGGWSTSAVQNLEVKAWVSGTEGQTSGVEAGIGKIEVFIGEAYYRNPHFGIVGNAIWVFDVDVEAGDTAVSWTTADLTSRGMTYGYRCLMSPLGVIENKTGIWTDQTTGTTCLRDFYVWHEGGTWHIIQHIGHDEWPYGFSFNYQPVYIKDIPEPPF